MVGVLKPSEKNIQSGLLILNIWKNKIDVPNHQHLLGDFSHHLAGHFPRKPSPSGHLERVSQARQGDSAAQHEPPLRWSLRGDSGVTSLKYWTFLRTGWWLSPTPLKNDGLRQLG
jgi:hypothetical protein